MTPTRPARDRSDCGDLEGGVKGDLAGRAGDREQTYPQHLERDVICDKDPMKEKISVF